MTSHTGRLLGGIALTLAIALGTPSPSAIAQTTSTAAEVAKRLDPTDFRTRFETRLEHQQTQEGGTRQITVPRFEYAFSNALAARIDVPFQRSAPGTPGQSTQTGMGDVTVRGAWRAFKQDGFALMTGSELILDTATEPALGLGKNIVAPFAFAALNAPSLNSMFFPGFEHYESVSGQSGRQRVSFTQFRLYILTRWPHRSYTLIENQLTVDYVRNSRVGFTIEVEAGHFLNKHLALWARPGVGLAGDQLPYIYNWNFEVGVRYLFD